MTKQMPLRPLTLPGVAAFWLLFGCYEGIAADGPATRPEVAVVRYVEAMTALDENYLTAHTCEGANLGLLVSRLDELGVEGRALFESLVFEPDPSASTANRLVWVASFLRAKVTIAVRADLDHCIESLE